jgi:hypothetical protein
MPLILNPWQEVTGKATEVHKLEQRIPKIQRSLDEADVRVLTTISIINPALYVGKIQRGYRRG